MTHSRQDWEPPLTATSDWKPPVEPVRPLRRSGRWLRYVAVVLGAIVLLGAGALAGYLIMGLPTPKVAVAEATPAAPPAEASVESPAAPPAVEAPATDAPADNSVIENIGDWVLVCASEETQPQCALQQRLAEPDGSTALMWSIYRDGQGTLRAVWQMPPKVETAPGIAIDLGDGAPRTVPFEGCDATLCSVRATLAPQFIAQLEAATTVSAVVMMSADRQLVRYRLSAAGLAEALPRLR